MRTKLLFDDVDAGAPQTSDAVSFDDKRGEWQLQITSTGLDGTPRIVIEYSADNDAGIWSPLENTHDLNFYFAIDDSNISVLDDRMQGKWFRIRLEQNDNTTGTLKADLAYNTYP